MLNHQTISAALLETLATQTIMADASSGADRISYFLEAANGTIETEFKNALTDFKAMHKDDKTMSVRASEFQTIYYGNLHNINLADMGYHAAVSHARKALQELGLRTNGKPILSEEEKQANREATLRRKAAQEANKLVDFGQPDALVKLAEEIEKQANILREAEAQKALERKFTRVKDLVASITADGEEFAMEVWTQLGGALGFDVVETEEGEQKAA